MITKYIDIDNIIVLDQAIAKLKPFTPEEFCMWRLFKKVRAVLDKDESNGMVASNVGGDLMWAGITIGTLEAHDFLGALNKLYAAAEGYMLEVKEDTDWDVYQKCSDLVHYVHMSGRC